MDFATTNTTYVYDGMGRLTNEYIGDKSIAYYYDANGNRTLMNNDGNITSYTYDKNNRLLTESANGETITYTYDANGNTLTAGEKEYTYNSRGQQIGYSDGTVTATYAYNPSGLRSQKTVGGSTKYFVYNGMQIVFEYEDSISDGTTYYYGLNRTHSSDGDVYVYNAHGDTVQLVNNNAVVASYIYDAFGNLTNTVGTSDNAFLYCSEYFDAETETYYLRARYYNPANGRFTQQDSWEFMNSVDPLSLNLYTYCANNPVAYLDPSGRFGVLGVIAVIVGVGITLSSCGSNTTTEKLTQDVVITGYDTVEYDTEFFTPGSPMYCGGYPTYEMALEVAYSWTYAAAFDEYGISDQEYMSYIYEKEIIDGIIAYGVTSPYEDPVLGYDGTSVSGHAEYAHGYTIVASVHTHPEHRETNIYSDLEGKRPYINYVIDNEKYLFSLEPGRGYEDFTNHGQVEIVKLDRFNYPIK